MTIKKNAPERTELKSVQGFKELLITPKNQTLLYLKCLNIEQFYQTAQNFLITIIKNAA